MTSGQNRYQAASRILPIVTHFQVKAQSPEVVIPDQNTFDFDVQGVLRAMEKNTSRKVSLDCGDGNFGRKREDDGSSERTGSKSIPGAKDDASMIRDAKTIPRTNTDLQHVSNNDRNSNSIAPMKKMRKNKGLSKNKLCLKNAKRSAVVPRHNQLDLCRSEKCLGKSETSSDCNTYNSGEGMRWCEEFGRALERVKEGRKTKSSSCLLPERKDHKQRHRRHRHALTAERRQQSQYDAPNTLVSLNVRKNKHLLSEKAAYKVSGSDSFDSSNGSRQQTLLPNGRRSSIRSAWAGRQKQGDIAKKQGFLLCAQLLARMPDFKKTSQRKPDRGKLENVDDMMKEMLNRHPPESQRANETDLHFPNVKKPAGPVNGQFKKFERMLDELDSHLGKGRPNERRRVLTRMSHENESARERTSSKWATRLKDYNQSKNPIDEQSTRHLEESIFPRIVYKQKPVQQMACQDTPTPSDADATSKGPESKCTPSTERPCSPFPALPSFDTHAEGIEDKGTCPKMKDQKPKKGKWIDSSSGWETFVMRDNNTERYMVTAKPQDPRVAEEYQKQLDSMSQADRDKHIEQEQAVQRSLLEKLEGQLQKEQKEQSRRQELFKTKVFEDLRKRKEMLEIEGRVNERESKRLKEMKRQINMMRTVLFAEEQEKMRSFDKIYQEEENEMSRLHTEELQAEQERALKAIEKEKQRARLAIEEIQREASKVAMEEAEKRFERLKAIQETEIATQDEDADDDEKAGADSDIKWSETDDSEESDSTDENNIKNADTERQGEEADNEEEEIGSEDEKIGSDEDNEFDEITAKKAFEGEKRDGEELDTNEASRDEVEAPRDKTGEDDSNTNKFAKLKQLNQRGEDNEMANIFDKTAHGADKESLEVRTRSSDTNTPRSLGSEQWVADNISERDSVLGSPNLSVTLMNAMKFDPLFVKGKANEFSRRKNKRMDTSTEKDERAKRIKVSPQKKSEGKRKKGKFYEEEKSPTKNYTAKVGRSSTVQHRSPGMQQRSSTTLQRSSSILQQRSSTVLPKRSSTILQQRSPIIQQHIQHQSPTTKQRKSTLEQRSPPVEQSSLLAIENQDLSIQQSSDSIFEQRSPTTEESSAAVEGRETTNEERNPTPKESETKPKKPLDKVVILGQDITSQYEMLLEKIESEHKWPQTPKKTMHVREKAPVKKVVPKYEEDLDGENDSELDLESPKETSVHGLVDDAVGAECLSDEENKATTWEANLAPHANVAPKRRRKSIAALIAESPLAQDVLIQLERLKEGKDVASSPSLADLYNAPKTIPYVKRKFLVGAARTTANVLTGVGFGGRQQLKGQMKREMIRMRSALSEMIREPINGPRMKKRPKIREKESEPEEEEEDKIQEDPEEEQESVPLLLSHSPPPTSPPPPEKEIVVEPSPTSTVEQESSDDSTETIRDIGSSVDSIVSMTRAQTPLEEEEEPLDHEPRRTAVRTPSLIASRSTSSTKTGKVLSPKTRLDENLPYPESPGFELEPASTDIDVIVETPPTKAPVESVQSTSKGAKMPALKQVNSAPGENKDDAYGGPAAGQPVDPRESNALHAGKETQVDVRAKRLSSTKDYQNIRDPQSSRQYQSPVANSVLEKMQQQSGSPGRTVRSRGPQLPLIRPTNITSYVNDEAQPSPSVKETITLPSIEAKVKERPQRSNRTMTRTTVHKTEEVVPLSVKGGPLEDRRSHRTESYSSTAERLSSFVRKNRPTSLNTEASKLQPKSRLGQVDDSVGTELRRIKDMYGFTDRKRHMITQIMQAAKIATKIDEPKGEGEDGDEKRLKVSPKAPGVTNKDGAEVVAVPKRPGYVASPVQQSKRYGRRVSAPKKKRVKANKSRSSFIRPVSEEKQAPVVQPSITRIYPKRPGQEVSRHRVSTKRSKGVKRSVKVSKSPVKKGDHTLEQVQDTTVYSRSDRDPEKQRRQILETAPARRGEEIVPSLSNVHRKHMEKEADPVSMKDTSLRLPPIQQDSRTDSPDIPGTNVPMASDPLPRVDLPQRQRPVGESSASQDEGSISSLLVVQGSPEDSDASLDMMNLSPSETMQEEGVRLPPVHPGPSSKTRTAAGKSQEHVENAKSDSARKGETWKDQLSNKGSTKQRRPSPQIAYNFDEDNRMERPSPKPETDPSGQQKRPPGAKRQTKTWLDRLSDDRQSLQDHRQKNKVHYSRTRAAVPVNQQAQNQTLTLPKTTDLSAVLKVYEDKVSQLTDETSEASSQPSSTTASETREQQHLTLQNLAQTLAPHESVGILSSFFRSFFGLSAGTKDKTLESKFEVKSDSVASSSTKDGQPDNTRQRYSEQVKMEPEKVKNEKQKHQKLQPDGAHHDRKQPEKEQQDKQTPVKVQSQNQQEGNAQFETQQGEAQSQDQQTRQPRVKKEKRSVQWANNVEERLIREDTPVLEFQAITKSLKPESPVKGEPSENSQINYTGTQSAADVLLMSEDTHEDVYNNHPGGEAADGKEMLDNIVNDMQMNQPKHSAKNKVLSVTEQQALNQGQRLSGNMGRKKGKTKKRSVSTRGKRKSSSVNTIEESTARPMDEYAMASGRNTSRTRKSQQYSMLIRKPHALERSKSSDPGYRDQRWNKAESTHHTHFDNKFTNAVDIPQADHGLETGQDFSNEMEQDNFARDFPKMIQNHPYDVDELTEAERGAEYDIDSIEEVSTSIVVGVTGRYEDIRIDNLGDIFHTPHSMSKDALSSMKHTTQLSGTDIKDSNDPQVHPDTHNEADIILSTISSKDSVLVIEELPTYDSKNNSKEDLPRHYLPSMGEGSEKSDTWDDSEGNFQTKAPIQYSSPSPRTRIIVKMPSVSDTEVVQESSKEMPKVNTQSMKSSDKGPQTIINSTVSRGLKDMLRMYNSLEKEQYDDTVPKVKTAAETWEESIPGESLHREKVKRAQAALKAKCVKKSDGKRGRVGANTSLVEVKDHRLEGTKCVTERKDRGVSSSSYVRQGQRKRNSSTPQLRHPEKGNRYKYSSSSEVGLKASTARGNKKERSRRGDKARPRCGPSASGVLDDVLTEMSERCTPDLMSGDIDQTARLKTHVEGKVVGPPDKASYKTTQRTLDDDLENVPHRYKTSWTGEPKDCFLEGHHSETKTSVTYSKMVVEPIEKQHQNVADMLKQCEENRERLEKNPNNNYILDRTEKETENLVNLISQMVGWLHRKVEHSQEKKIATPTPFPLRDDKAPDVFSPLSRKFHTNIARAELMPNRQGLNAPLLKHELMGNSTVMESSSDDSGSGMSYRRRKGTCVEPPNFLKMIQKKTSESSYIYMKGSRPEPSEDSSESDVMTRREKMRAKITFHDASPPKKEISSPQPEENPPQAAEDAIKAVEAVEAVEAVKAVKSDVSNPAERTQSRTSEGFSPVPMSVESESALKENRDKAQTTGLTFSTKKGRKHKAKKERKRHHGKQLNICGDMKTGRSKCSHEKSEPVPRSKCEQFENRCNKSCSPLYSKKMFRKKFTIDNILKWNNGMDEETKPDPIRRRQAEAQEILCAECPSVSSKAFDRERIACDKFLHHLRHHKKPQLTIDKVMLYPNSMLNCSASSCRRPPPTKRSACDLDEALTEAINNMGGSNKPSRYDRLGAKLLRDVSNKSQPPPRGKTYADCDRDSKTTGSEPDALSEQHSAMSKSQSEDFTREPRPPICQTIRSTPRDEIPDHALFTEALTLDNILAWKGYNTGYEVEIPKHRESIVSEPSEMIDSELPQNRKQSTKADAGAMFNVKNIFGQNFLGSKFKRSTAPSKKRVRRRSTASSDEATRRIQDDESLMSHGHSEGTSDRQRENSVFMKPNTFEHIPEELSFLRNQPLVNLRRLALKKMCAC